MNDEEQHHTKYTVSIPKDQFAAMPAESYNGRIVLVQDLFTATKALRYLSDQPMVGFDTETRPAFKKGQTHGVALMQLSSADCCFLFRISRLGLFPELKDFLENPTIVKIGLSTRDDFHVLNRISPVTPQGFIELQTLVKEYMISDISVTKIYAILFGSRISKGQRLTNWEAVELTEAQQRYAALDAWACLRIYNHLISGRFIPTESPFYHPVTEPQPQEQ